MSIDEQFSVFWWDIQGNQHEELRWVTAVKAYNAIVRLTRGPASVLGIVQRVIITDGLDCTCFEWTKDQGIIFPKQGEKE